MSSDYVFTAIKDFLVANWTETPLRFENETPMTTAAPEPFVLVELGSDTLEQLSTGSGIRSDNFWRESGSLWLSVLVRSGTGSLLARQYARQLAQLFMQNDGLIADALTFSNISVGLGSPGQEDGNYWAITVLVSWQFNF